MTTKSTTPVDQIAALTKAIADAEQQRAAAVAAARAEGRSWSEIGAALGTTKQGAHLRYGRRES